MKWILGIDLGTTNSTLAALPLEAKQSAILQFPIPQKNSLTGMGESYFLPSFYYLPLEEEGQNPFVGIFAKQRGEELPDRLIASAKSWLCHEGIHPDDPFLPLGDFTPKHSALEVLASYLEHLKNAWNQVHFSEAPFEEQQILITVPASFSPRAREFVQEAAKKVGIHNPILLEEPLAAFYAWLEGHEKSWRSFLSVGDVVLVVDCGGGTTDFTLIHVEENQGELQLVRQAVGDHLLLGGDNIDLALAHFAASQITEDLDEWQFQKLSHLARKAKEELLSDSGKEKLDLSIPGRGSRLIGNSLKFSLNQKEIETFLLQGFFPKVALAEQIEVKKRSGLSQMGLPYADDPRITAHLAHFLSRYATRMPNTVLFNGGTLKAACFRKQILSLLEEWSQQEVRELPEANLDFAVGRGAAYYGWAREGKGIRVRAGTTRSYFIGIASAAPAVPGMAPPLKAICIAPKGMEEGTEITLPHQECLLSLGESALFRFFYTSESKLPTGEDLQVGTTVKKWEHFLHELPSVETLLTSEADQGNLVKVKLAAKITELGVLELWCLSSTQKWKLELNVRKEENELLVQ